MVERQSYHNIYWNKGLKVTIVNRTQVSVTLQTWKVTWKVEIATIIYIYIYNPFNYVTPKKMKLFERLVATPFLNYWQEIKYIVTNNANL